MTTVTFHDTDSPGTRLLKLEEQLLIERPHLSPAHARHLIKDANPALYALDHAGLMAEPEPTVDPGELLNKRAHQLLMDGQALTRGEAISRAMAENPDAAKAYAAASMMPVTMATERHQADEPTRRNADPGLELMALVEQRMQADCTLTVAMAQAAVLRSDPALAAAYAGAVPLPLADGGTRTRQSVDQTTRETLAELAQIAAELDSLQRLFDGPPSVATFAAEIGADQISGSTIKGIPIFTVGTWNGKKYTARDLDDMVAAFGAVGYRPPVTLGHTTDPSALAHGFVSALRRDGDRLLADLSDVPPETVELIKSGRLLSVSAEIYFDLKRGTNTYPRALRALSLLGAHPPGVAGLPPLKASLPEAA